MVIGKAYMMLREGTLNHKDSFALCGGQYYCIIDLNSQAISSALKIYCLIN